MSVMLNSCCVSSVLPVEFSLFCNATTFSGMLHLNTVADANILKRGRKTIYELRPHLLQMCTTKYMPFTWKSGFL